MRKLKVKITLTEPMLGTKSANEELFTKFIAGTRPEGVAAGTLRLVGTDEHRIVRETARLLEDAEAYEAMSAAVNPYGDGRASERIADAIVRRYG